MAKKLTLSISEYDDDIKTIVAPALNGGLDVTFKKYSTLPDLTAYEGEGKYPLTLVGHANGLGFKTGIGLGDRIDGTAVADHLLKRNLKVATFPFCLIAGCSAASDKVNGLYVVLAKSLGMPVVASSTAIKMSRVGENVELIPQNSGVWRVYFPADDERCELTTARCNDIRGILDKQEFKCKLGVA